MRASLCLFVSMCVHAYVRVGVRGSGWVGGYLPFLMDESNAFIFFSEGCFDIRFYHYHFSVV